MTADERNPGSRPHHHLLEHLKRGGEDQAIMLVEGEARRAAAAEQLLDVARLLLEARQFVGIDFLLRGLGFRDPLEQQRGPVGRSDGRTHEQRRSEEHTSELQSLMRISYAVFCLKKQQKKHKHKIYILDIK